MKIEIINKIFTVSIYGFSGTALNKDYTGTTLTLMDKMWQTVKKEELKNKGTNIWVYDLNEQLFAGVELIDNPAHHTKLEHKTIHLPVYAYYKHIGPYTLIKKAGLIMRDELKIRGFETCFPYIEIYGHLTNDETKLETELLMSLQ